MDNDTGEVHIAKAAGKDRECVGSCEKKDCDGAENGSREVKNSIREPGEDVKDNMLVCGEDVAEIRAVKDVFESGENANPDMWAVATWNEAVGNQFWVLPESRRNDLEWA